jgi:hypothetical protein
MWVSVSVSSENLTSSACLCAYRQSTACVQESHVYCCHVRWLLDNGCSSQLAAGHCHMTDIRYSSEKADACSVGWLPKFHTLLLWTFHTMGRIWNSCICMYFVVASTVIGVFFIIYTAWESETKYIRLTFVFSNRPCPASPESYFPCHFVPRGIATGFCWNRTQFLPRLWR